MVKQLRKVLYDTNILIDATKGISAAIAELEHWDDPAISCISWIELHAGAVTAKDNEVINDFMGSFGFKVYDLNEGIMRVAAEIMLSRRASGGKLKVPDAIIAATANTEDLVLVTRNSRDFREVRFVRTAYTLVTEQVVRVENELTRGADPSPTSRKREGRRITIR